MYIQRKVIIMDKKWILIIILYRIIQCLSECYMLCVLLRKVKVDLGIEIFI